MCVCVCVCVFVITSAYPLCVTMIQSQQHQQLIHAVQVQGVVLVAMLSKQAELTPVIAWSHSDGEHCHT